MYGNEKIKILTAFYGASPEETFSEPEGKKEQETTKHVVNIEETMSEWTLLKHLVKEHMYPNDSLSRLWQIIYKHHKDNFPNLFQLARLALIIPLQTADCERGFSRQNLIKDAQRNRLSGERLTKLMRISLLKESIEDFNVDVTLKLSNKNKVIMRAFTTTKR